jgi:four helix bundle protein
VVEEADETENWLIAIKDAGLSTAPELTSLTAEASELRAIFAASLKTARRNHPPRRPPR